MTEKKFDSKDEEIVKKELRQTLKIGFPIFIFLSFITLGTFVIPIGFLSRTARRMGEYTTLYEIHEEVAVMVTIVIYILVLLSYIIYFKLFELLSDNKNKIKVVKKIKVLRINELSEKEKKQWSTLNKNHTHQIYINYNDKKYFNSSINPELLNATIKEIEYSKATEILLSEKYY